MVQVSHDIAQVWGVGLSSFVLYSASIVPQARGEADNIMDSHQTNSLNALLLEVA